MKQLRPEASRELRGARENTRGLDTPCVASLYRFVNALLFHLQPLSGLILAGGWCDRLALWLPLVDAMRETLRVMGAAR